MSCVRCRACGTVIPGAVRADDIPQTEPRVFNPVVCRGCGQLGWFRMRVATGPGFATVESAIERYLRRRLNEPASNAN